MITEKIKVDGVDLFLVPSGFTFVRQTCVKFYGKRLSKRELILCCEYFISELKLFYDAERLKIGFNLKCFKYYELSVYLHGLISLYCSVGELSCPSCFGLFRFSHLPHDVLKSDKKVREIHVSYIKDMFGGSSYCCVICDKPWAALSLDVLRQQLLDNYEFLRKYHLEFVVN